MSDREVRTGRYQTLERTGSDLSRGAVESQFGMPAGIVCRVSTQIAIRLPEEMVAFLDRAVAAGKASSRAALVSSALEREMRRLLAEQDVAILTEVGAADDLDALVDWSVGHLDIGE